MLFAKVITSDTAATALIAVDWMVASKTFHQVWRPRDLRDLCTLLWTTITRHITSPVTLLALSKVE